MAGSTPRARAHERRRPALPRPPLWAQWVISLLVAATLIVLLVRFVDANSTPRAQAPHLTPKGVKSLNAEAEILDSEQQAPHVLHYGATVAPLAAIERAIAAYMTKQIDFAQIAGPLRATLCFAVPAGGAPDLAYRCSALARATSYPFEGVVDRAARTVTYCRHNPPPNPGDNVPVSRRCAG
ncbi:MAG: hypothetical protein ACLP0J_04110 [Solirubrobacteraceae bacterium]